MQIDAEIGEKGRFRMETSNEQDLHEARNRSLGVLFSGVAGVPADRILESAMKTYYLEFRAQEVLPGTADNLAEEKLVRFWVVDRDPDGALRRAHHYLVQNGWKPDGLERSPEEVPLPQADAAEEDAACYEQAQRYGISMAVID